MIYVHGSSDLFLLQGGSASLMCEEKGELTHVLSSPHLPHSSSLAHQACVKSVPPATVSHEYCGFKLLLTVANKVLPLVPEQQVCVALLMGKGSNISGDLIQQICYAGFFAACKGRHSDIRKCKIYSWSHNNNVCAVHLG